jgi:polyisoprenoid-binding protein YceI
VTHLSGRHIRTRTVCALGVTLLLAILGSLAQSQTALPPATELALTLDPAKSTVHWTVDSTLHTVHGTFTVKNGSLHFDRTTGAASGEIDVSTASGESGSGSRDGRMHREILETAKYPDALFHPKQVDGKVTTSGTSDVKLRGILSIHGSDHDITTQVHIEITGSRWTGTSQFEIPYVQWGIKDPSNFLLKVKPVVNVEVEMTGTVESAK